MLVGGLKSNRRSQMSVAIVQTVVIEARYLDNWFHLSPGRWSFTVTPFCS